MKYGNTGTENFVLRALSLAGPIRPVSYVPPCVVRRTVVDESMTKIVTAECLLAPGSHLIIQGADA